ncbi:MAG: hypothetical protein IT177_20795 [Acidobacteria bacterium]|nr:hypothetical protein [Acidobacteriota bacterium]
MKITLMLTSLVLGFTIGGAPAAAAGPEGIARRADIVRRQMGQVRS